MNVSVIICTYNRCDSLKRTLQACCDLVIPDGVTWELLVVDNNSTDATKQVCEACTGKLPLHYIFEPRQGKSDALNTAVAVAKGDVYLFTDDDVDVSPDWLSVFWDAAKRHPQASFWGGPIRPKWEVPPPRWMSENSSGLLTFISMSVDWGDQECLLREDDKPFLGANLAFRSNVFSEAFRFDLRLGPRGDSAINGEETDLLQRLMAAGHSGLYIPTAVVYHRNPHQRMTERYLRRYYVGTGRRNVRLGESADSPQKLFNAPRYLWRQLVVSACTYSLHRFTSRSKVWLAAEIRMATVWGQIVEFQQHALSPAAKQE